MIDLRCQSRPDGLWRQCLLCGTWFRLTPSKADIEYGTTRDGERRIKRYQPGEGYPRNLLQVTCGTCPIIGGSEYATSQPGRSDPRWRLRADGLESWRDANG